MISRWLGTFRSAGLRWIGAAAGVLMLFPPGAHSRNALEDANLVALYHLDESLSATTYVDSSFSGNNGTCTGSACPRNIELGKFNGAAAFDGDDEIVVPDNSNLDNTSTLTIQAWFFPTQLSGDPRGIVSKRVGQSSGQSWSVYVHTADRIYIDIDKQATDNRFFVVPAVQINRWYHIAVVYNGALAATNRVNVYLNGMLESGSPHNEGSASIPDYASDMTIGALNVGYAQDFVGIIDEVAIHNAALPADAVTEAFRRGAWRHHLQMDFCGGTFCDLTQATLPALFRSHLFANFRLSGWAS